MKLTMIPEKMMIIQLSKQMKKNKKMMSSQLKQQDDKNNNRIKKIKSSRNRFLVIVTVLGSTGPLRFLVNEDDRVDRVIDTALKLYSREGRIPILGSDPHKFLLYTANAGFDALDGLEEIGLTGGRSFVLCKKPNAEARSNMTEARSEMITSRKSSGGGGGGGSWKSWLNKSFSFKIISH